MLCVIEIDCTDRVKAAKQICQLTMLAVDDARSEIRSGRVPKLYQSGIRYVSQSPKACCFKTPLQVIKAKGGDCKQLVIWRIAELLEAGEPVTPRVLWVEEDANGKPVKGFRAHEQLRRADGTIEDPSVILGMKPPRKLAGE